MRLWPSRARLRAFARLASPLALALSLVALFATPSIGQGDRRAMLKQRTPEIVDMFEKDPRYNKGRMREEMKDAVEFLTGTMLFVLAHESAHALISEFDLPVLSRQEDAADAFATIAALKMDNVFTDRMVINAGIGWILSDKRKKKAGIRTKFHGEHGLDMQRAYYVVCLMVGAQPEKFAVLADLMKMPAERQADCEDDYRTVSQSWERVLKPHRRKSDNPKTNIEVNYAPTTRFATPAALGRNLQMLETMAEWLSQDFLWPRPLALEMQECGAPDARWDPDIKKMIVCYDMIDDFFQMFRDSRERLPDRYRQDRKSKIERSVR